MSSIPLKPAQPRINWLHRVNRVLDLATYDFCPSYNKYLRWLWKPVGWVALALFSSVLLAIFVAPQCWALAACLAAVLILGLAWPAIAVASLRVRWETDRATCQEGDEAVIRLRVENRMPWPVFGLTIDPLGEACDSEEQRRAASVSLAVVKPRSESVFTFRRIMHRRGLYPNGDLELRSGFPFGLWQAKRKLDAVRPLIVTPWVTDLSINVSGGASQQVGPLVSSHRAGRVGQVSGYRAWMPEDSFRDIDWVQSARRPHLVTRQRYSAERPTVALAIQAAGVEAWDGEMREVAVRWLASVVTSLLKNDWQVIVACDGAWQTIQPGRFSAARWLEQLAVMRPSALLAPLPPTAAPASINWVFDLTPSSARRVEPRLLKFKRVDVSHSLSRLIGDAEQKSSLESDSQSRIAYFESHRMAFHAAWRSHEQEQRHVAS